MQEFLKTYFFPAAAAAVLSAAVAYGVYRESLSNLIDKSNRNEQNIEANIEAIADARNDLLQAIETAVNKSQSEIQKTITDNQGFIWKLNEEKEKRLQLNFDNIERRFAEQDRRHSEEDKRLDRLEQGKFDKHTGLEPFGFHFADLLIVDHGIVTLPKPPPPRHKIYDDEIALQEFKIAALQARLKKLRDPTEQANLSTVIWQMTIQLEYLRSEQDQCELDDIRRAACWALKNKTRSYN